MAVKIIDCTLREGNQAPDVKLSLDEAVNIARMLDAVGVDMIECGHAIVGQDERDRIAALRHLELNAPLLSHARATEADILAAAQSGSQWVGIFCGLNRISRTSRLGNRTQGTVIDTIRRTVALAKKHGLGVRYTLEDASRTPMQIVHRALHAAIEEGADRICFADTLGAMTPPDFQRTMAELVREFPGTSIEIHIHDDRGFAMANTWGAIEAGVEWISASVNGVGERCGITDLILLLANLDQAGLRSVKDGNMLQQLSRYVGAVTRSPPDHRRPISGRNAFAHTAKLHTNAVLKAPLAYAIFDANRLGREIRIAPPPDRPGLRELIVKPEIICATELKHHRSGPGARHVMVDERFVRDARQYCIAREIPHQDEPAAKHVDPHRHICDSLFIFAGHGSGLAGLEVEVQLEGETQMLSSPAALLIPAGMLHSYRVISGAGIYINHVLHGEYNSSLLEPEIADCDQAESETDNVFCEIRDQVRSFVCSAANVSPSSFGDDDDLFELGVIDSLSTLEVLFDVECLGKSLGYQVDLRKDEIRSLRNLCSMLVRPNIPICEVS